MTVTATCFKSIYGFANDLDWYDQVLVSARLKFVKLKILQHGWNTKILLRALVTTRQIVGAVSNEQSESMSDIVGVMISFAVGC